MFRVGLRNLAFVIGFVILGFNSTQAQAGGTMQAGAAQSEGPGQEKPWISIGSAGSVDESDTSKVSFENSFVQIGQVAVVGGSAKNPAALPQQIQSAVIRYNITAVDGLLEPPGSAVPRPAGVMALRYLAQGNGAAVLAKLIEVDLASGAEKNLATFDSTKVPPGTGYRTQPLAAGVCDMRFDFKKKTYYVDVTLKANSGPFVGSAAGIQWIKVEFGFCLVSG